MAEQHTPTGPWHVFSVYAQHEVLTKDGDLIAVVTDQKIARLIASLPELLEALDACAGTLECFEAPADSVIGKNIAAARAAIATTQPKEKP